jgi:hypothetical protein
LTNFLERAKGRKVYIGFGVSIGHDRWKAKEHRMSQVYMSEGRMPDTAGTQPAEDCIFIYGNGSDIYYSGTTFDIYINPLRTEFHLNNI